jgi:hypothetical protein
MAFDFLKKNELLEIKQQKAEISNLNEKIVELSKEIAKLSKYQPIIDIDAEISKKKIELQKIEDNISDLTINYDVAKKVYDDLKHQTELYSESLDLADYGVYAPHFEFGTSEEYKAMISAEREFQKIKIQAGTAVSGGEGISWNGSVSQGEAMVKRQKKLMLRAFNGECDSFIASVDWNNVSKMQERIGKSFEAINAVYDKQGIKISNSYADSKLKELWLAYEYKRKKYEEKEEQRQIREQMREEEKVTREIEAARIKAEKEEIEAQKAIEKAKQELATADSKNQAILEAKIKELEERLKEAEQNKERALSMAQQTKRGHVYIISNIGSFGENVYKIGMTRRLEPMDRVKELGDASVPFYYDIHALIFSEDAPRLENELHVAFDNKRVNAVNYKKEFFNVSLDEIEQFVKEKKLGNFEFTKIAEAEEYRETLAIRNKKSEIAEKTDNQFPEKIF